MYSSVDTCKSEKSPDPIYVLLIITKAFDIAPFPVDTKRITCTT